MENCSINDKNTKITYQKAELIYSYSIYCIGNEWLHR